ncbi:MAG: glycosyltransferase family 4 protein [Planctomycetota bacterium]
MRPKILYLCTACPFAPSFGAQLRTLATAMALREIGDITTVLVTARDWGEEALQRTRDELNLRAVIPVVKTPKMGIGERLRHELDPRFIKTTGSTVSEEDRQRVREWIAEHDMVWVTRLEVANTLGIYDWPNTVLDLDDLRSQYFLAEIGHTKGLYAKLLARRKAFLARRRELATHERFTILTVCSENDRPLLPNAKSVHVVPNGFPPPTTEPVYDPSSEPRLGFIGLLAYPPNLTGLKWFADNVWPLVRQQIPQATLRVVGKGWDGAGLSHHPGFEGLGFVDDVEAEMNSWRGTIVPVLFGAGTRIKIAEAFSRRIPIVSTTIGAYGYPATHEREMLLADEAQDFADSCVRIIKDPSFAASLADRGWDMYVDGFSWEAIGERIRAAAEECLQQAGKLAKDPA